MMNPPAGICRKAQAFSVFFLLLATLTMGCESSKKDYFGTTKPRHPPDELWVNNGTEPEWIDPGRCSDTNGGEVIWNIFAGLVEAHPATLDPVPDIAESWESSDDGRVYTFHLRKSTWSDGKPLTAHDFEWSWKRILDPALASKYVSNMYIFQNAQARTRGAIYVTGLPATTNAQQVKEFVARVVPRKTDTSNSHAEEGETESEHPKLESVEWTDWPHSGALVYLTGDRKQIEHSVHEKIATALTTEFGNEVKTQFANASHVGIRALDDYTLEVRLRDPIPYFLNFLSFYSFSPVPRHLLERLEKEGIDTNYWTRPEHIVSNGPYLLKEWRFRQYMIFEANPRYWNADDPSICRVQRVKALQVESYNTCLNLYFAGEIDFPGGNTNLPAEFVSYLRTFKDFRFDPYLAIYFFWFNTEQAPVDNVHVRRALSLAVNREELVEFVTRAQQIPLSSIVPDGLAGYKGLDLPVFDPEAAKEELAKAGYPDGKGLPKITVMYNTSEGHKQIAEALQQMWKKHLGIDVAIENQEWKVFLKTMNQTQFQMARLGWIGDYADPYTFLELMTSDCGNNHSNWSNENYDRLIRQANASTDTDKRLSLLREAEKIAVENLPILPIYVYTRAIVVKPYVRGMWGNYQDRHLWKYMWVDKQWYDGIPETPSPDPAPPVPTLN